MTANKRQVVASMMLLAKEHDYLLNDCEEEESSRCRRSKVPRVEDYYEVVIPQMSDTDFRQSFRLTRETFDDLVSALASKIDRCSVTVSVGRSSVTAEKQHLIAIQMLANQDPYRSIANLFNISKSTAWNITLRVCHALVELNQEENIISWPRGQEAVDVIRDFERVIGAIDGSHIPIKAPGTEHVSYINRKGFHSILLQAVCNKELVFTDCYVGEVGSVHDACMLRRSDLAAQMSTNTAAMFPMGSHLIGDPAYPLSVNLMVPFKDNGRLDARQRKFNMRLSGARSVIERAFAMLKGRFRRLKYVDATRTENIPVIVMACCVLHNFCMTRGDCLDDFEDDLDDNSCQPITQPVRNQQSNAGRRRDGAAKRDRITQAL